MESASRIWIWSRRKTVFSTFLLLSFVTAAPEAHAWSLWSFCRSLLVSPESKDPVQRLLDENRDQEAIWQLMSKDPKGAKLIRERLKEKLRSGKATKRISLERPDAMNNSGRLILDNGASGIAKNSEDELQAGGMMSFRNEVFASDLDEAIHLNRVPTSVYRVTHIKHIDSDKRVLEEYDLPGSIQFWVKKARGEEPKTISAEMKALNKREWNFYQYLVDYKDDHQGNILYTSEGYRIFIDNAGILTHSKPPLDVRDLEIYVPRREVYERLRDWPENEIRSLFARHEISDVIVIDAFLFRRGQLIEKLAPFFK